MKAKGPARCLAHTECLTSGCGPYSYIHFRSAFSPSGSPESAFLFQQRDTKVSEILNNHTDTCTFELNFGNVTKKTAYPESTHLHETGTSERNSISVDFLFGGGWDSLVGKLLKITVGW